MPSIAIVPSGSCAKPIVCRNTTSCNTSLPIVKCHLAFIWLADDPMKSETVHKRLLSLLNRAADRLQLPESASAPQ